MDPFVICISYMSLSYSYCLSIPFDLVVTSREMTDLLSLLCQMFSCIFVTFPNDVLGLLCCLIVLISDLCLRAFFEGGAQKNRLNYVVLLK